MSAPAVPTRGNLISFGPNANCTLALCPLERSILHYQPSIPGNAAIIALFAISLVLHLAQGFYWRTWGFAISLALGCIDEMVGYGGRILLHNNPFSFIGFVMQIVCITTAPVFICAAIYVTLSRTIEYLDPSISRFNPKLLYWIFIPADLLSLALQAGGGAVSSNSSGKNQTGVNVSLVGLGLQVVTLFIFIVIAADYLIRYSKTSGLRRLQKNTKVFTIFLGISILLILVRCVYRIDELRDGYSGELIRNEPLFMVLESVMIVLAVFCLNVAQPGYGLQKKMESSSSMDEEAMKHPRS